MATPAIDIVASPSCSAVRFALAFPLAAEIDVLRVERRRNQVDADADTVRVCRCAQPSSGTSSTIASAIAPSDETITPAARAASPRRRSSTSTSGGSECEQPDLRLRRRRSGRRASSRLPVLAATWWTLGFSTASDIAISADEEERRREDARDRERSLRRRPQTAHRYMPPRLDDPREELARSRLARRAEDLARAAPPRGSRRASRKQTLSATSRANDISCVAMIIVMPALGQLADEVRAPRARAADRARS